MEIKGVDFDTINYIPHVKGIGFHPSPIAGNIPKWADSNIYPKVKGTQAWSDFWTEQIHYCINGYDTGGVHISGIEYDWLNFNILEVVGGGFTYADYVDIQHDLWDAYCYCKENNITGIVVPKKRRFGFSAIAAHIVSYGMRYNNGYKFMIGAGLEKYTDKLRSKLYTSYNNRPQEMILNTLVKNDDEMILGYEEKTEQGYIKHEYAHGYFYTFGDNPKKAEGEYYDDVILDEIGDFQRVCITVQSIIPALKRGDITKGIIIAGGTGGNVAKGGAGMHQLYHQADTFGFMRFPVLGKRYHLPCIYGAKSLSEKVIKEGCPNIEKDFPNLKPEQLLGCEDIVEAQRLINVDLAKKIKNPNKKLYIDAKQQYPETVEDIFTSSGSNNFNSEILNKRLFEIESSIKHEWTEWILDFETNKQGDVELPLKVKARPAEPKDHDDLKIMIKYHPRLDIANLDIGGCDGYNDDKTQTTKSLGATYVLRQNNLLSSDQIPTDQEKALMPVCCYAKRPKRKEIFWKVTLLISVYYGLYKNMMIAAEADLIIKYFLDNFGKKYLAKRPRQFDSPDSKLMHEYGAKMTSYSKPRMLGLLQTYIEDWGMYAGPIMLIRDLINYDEVVDESDWDNADALGLALIRIADIKYKPRNSEENTRDTRSDMIEWVVNAQGISVPHYPENQGIKKEKWESIPSMFDEYEKRI